MFYPTCSHLYGAFERRADRPVLAGACLPSHSDPGGLVATGGAATDPVTGPVTDPVTGGTGNFDVQKPQKRV